MLYRITGRHRGEPTRHEVEAPTRFAAYSSVANRLDTVFWVGPASWFGYLQERLVPSPGAMEISVWTRQMATMIDAGVPLTKCLEITGQGDSPSLNLILWAVQKDIGSGHYLSVALSRHPMFPPEFAHMIRAGETTGRLPTVLRRLADDAEKSVRARRMLLSSLSYPICVIVFASLLTVWFLYEVVPALASIFTSLHAELPLITRLLIGGSRLIGSPLRLATLLGLAVGAAYLFKLSLRSLPRWRQALLEALTRVPVIGPLLKAQDDSRLLNTFASMLSSGVNLNQALPILRTISPLPSTRKGLVSVSKAVQEGVELSKACTAVGLFTPAVCQMLLVGEESGTLDRMMEWTSRLLDLEVEHRVADLIAMSEPFTMVALGGLAMFFVLGAFLPLISLMQALM